MTTDDLIATRQAATQAARDAAAQGYTGDAPDLARRLIRGGTWDRTPHVQPYITGALAAAEAVRAAQLASEPWRPMADAKKDRTSILVKIRDDLAAYTGRDDLDGFAGIQAVMRHPGLADDGFDIGWQFAAPVGQGGFPDDWFVGWKPLALVEQEEQTR